MTDNIWFSPAKLNLFLHVLGRRADGYHQLQTVFQLLDHGDTLHFTLCDGPEVTLSCNQPGLLSSDNLVLRAAQALRQHSGTRHGARIHLEKCLPAGAGLGGGSSNAATALLALNSLWGTGLDVQTLASLGLQLGADVPVFVHRNSAWAEGIGEDLTPVQLPERWYLVLTPPVHVATGEIFSHRELTRNGSAIKMHGFLTGCSRNDCEPLVRRLYPQVDATLHWLTQFAPARMTGTGASVFAAFDEQAQARSVLETLPESAQGALSGVTGFVARGVNRCP